jgi:SAM-dependent methyltransferase
MHDADAVAVEKPGRVPPLPAAPCATPWQRALDHLADGPCTGPFAGLFTSPFAGPFASPLTGPAKGRPTRTLWWGAGYSGLPAVPAQHLAQGVAHDILAVDTDPRQLRRCSAPPGTAARTARLLTLADLRRDAQALERALQGRQLHDIEGYLAFDEKLRHQATQAPTVADGWADGIVMDFVLNRVEPHEQATLLAEALRVLAHDGCLLAATLVSDTPLAEAHAVRGAPAGPALHIPTEAGLLQAFAQAGFHGIQLHWSAPENPPAIDHIGEADVRMCLVQAYQGKQGPCLELGQAVIYGGPWREVHDDDGHVYRRGARVAVCAKTYALLMRAPYQGTVVGLRSVHEPPLDQAAPFDCNTPALRDPRVTKGMVAVDGTRAAPAACAPGGGCC